MISESKVEVAYTKVCLMACYANSFFDRECSYLAEGLPVESREQRRFQITPLAQRFPMMCRLQQRFQITVLALESKVNVTYT